MDNTQQLPKPPYRKKQRFSETNIWRSLICVSQMYFKMNMSIRQDARNTIGNIIITNISNAATLMREAYYANSYAKKYKCALLSKRYIHDVDINIKILYECQLLALHQIETIQIELAKILVNLSKWISTYKKKINEIKQCNNKSNVKIK